METGQKTWALPAIASNLPRKHKALLLGVIAFGLVLLLSLAVMTKSITVISDGKKTSYLTVRKNVGDFLLHTKLNVYQEDLVVPERNTAIKRGMTVSLKRSVPITIKLDGQDLSFRTLSPDVGQALEDAGKKLGFSLKESDEVEPGRTEAVRSNMELTVSRSIPMSITADGTIKNFEMAPHTVAEVLDKQKLILGEKDLVNPGLDQAVTANVNIKVTRVTEKVLTLQTELPFQVVTKSADFPVGLPDRVIAHGSAGMDEQTVKVTYEDGVEVDRAILSQRTLRKPVEQVVARGSQTSVSRGGQAFAFKRAIQVRATAYSQPGGTTSVGYSVGRGVIAVDPGVIPYYSRMWVEGYGWGSALDTGGAIVGNRVDLYFDTEAEALAWGVRNIIVYVQ